jgi:hypothetical protein
MTASSTTASAAFAAVASAAAQAAPRRSRVKALETIIIPRLIPEICRTLAV